MNQYDNVQLDIPALLASTKAANQYDPQAQSPASAASVVNRYAIGAAYATGLLRRLTYANLKLGWFDEFRNYWIKELGLRRLELPDFYFLAGIYRRRFQALAVSESSDQDFLAAWQNPASLHLLFHYQYKLALHPLSAYTLAKYVKPGSRVCEYGCGLAPIAQSLLKYYPGLRLNLTVADIPSLLLHFVHWKFNRTPYVDIVHINPADDQPLEQTYDVIACMTVLEHLPRPLPIVKHLHSQLKPDGLFMFDYIKSEGDGLDTQSALDDRKATLEFIKENFEIIRGSIPLDEINVKSTICRKK